MSNFEQPIGGGDLAAPWPLGHLASYDCETTGTDVETDRIVTAALVVPGRETRRWMADPGIDIPSAASDIHHVTTAYARKHGQPAALVIDGITEALAHELATPSALVVMNAPFDLTLLDRECRRHGLPTLEDRHGGPIAPVIDPLVLDRAADKWRKGKRKLEVLAVHYGVKLDDAHAADADAQAALDVALKIGEKYPELAVPAAVIHGWQVTWHARWADGFEEYQRKTKPDTVISRDWPLVPFQAGEAS